MFDADDIRDWRGSSVVDQDGARIGSLEAIYFDTASSEPVFATVKVGLPGGLAEVPFWWASAPDEP